MKHIIHIFSIILLAAALLISFTGCGSARLDTSLVAINGRSAFAARLDDFADCFNRLYGEDYLPHSSGWTRVTIDECAHFADIRGIERYMYCEDKEVWTLPTLTVYATPDSGNILEVTVDYDDHGSSDGMAELYERLSECALRCFLPDADNNTIDTLFLDSFVATDEVVCSTLFLDSTGSPLIYEHGTVGVYPYFAYGECIHICIVPRDQ